MDIWFVKLTFQVRAGDDIHFGLMNGSLQWRHNERDGVMNHRCLDCLFNPLFRRRSKKTSKLRVTGLCEGNPPVTGGSPHKGPVIRKMFPFDDVILVLEKKSKSDRNPCYNLNTTTQQSTTHLCSYLMGHTVLMGRPIKQHMMTSSNGNIFRVTGHLWEGIHRSPVNSPHKGQWHGALMFSLICVWINGWLNNREASLWRHRNEESIMS